MPNGPHAYPPMPQKVGLGIRSEAWWNDATPDFDLLFEDMGHEVSAISITHADAVQQAHDVSPGLVLADIQLADGSSGLDAVREILETFDVPVVFITAYPERLLTGERPEPTFLVTKPFSVETVTATIGQALLTRQFRDAVAV